jgi:biopolymer transport protein ExbB
VAIPAVLGYNMFVRANRLLLAQLDGFAHDLHAALAVGPGAPSGSSVAPRAASPARPSSQAA